MALGLVLRLQGHLGVLAQDGDGGEALGLGARLGLGDLGLQGGVGGVALLGLGDDEAQRDEAVGVVELHQVVPIAFVEARQRGEDQHRLLVLDGGARGGDVVHVVVHHGRRGLGRVGLGLAEGQCGRRQRARGGVAGARLLGEGRPIAAGEEEDEEADAEDGSEHEGDGIRAAERA